MVARRLLIALAVLLGLTALAAGVAPRERLGTDSAPPASPAPTREQASGVVQRTLDAGATGQRVVARVGQTVVLTVRSDSLETVSLDDVGVKTAEPSSSARFELLADVPGSYAIDLLESEKRIGTLEIRGAG
jgi:hypothetical protein